jgi:uncharacterized membrane protein
MSDALGHRRNITKRIRGNFFTGVVVLIPLVLTAFIIWKMFMFLDGILGGIAHDLIGLDAEYIRVPGVGIISLILITIGTGMVARNYVGRKIVNFGDKIVERIPLINRVYSAIKQISQAFLASKREVFQKAVLFEYPRKGLYSIGFYTQDTRGIVQNSIDHDVVSVFLPTTPNPTSGFLLFVPKSEIKELDLSIEEALKLIISGGAIVPRTNTDKPKGEQEVTFVN